MKKIINPCTCEVYTSSGNFAKANAFVEITYENGKLSLHGVIGPMSNGDCKGSCGQCNEEIRDGTPKEPWTKEMIKKLCDIWEEWHLNDMRPYCQHQKELGWREQARERIDFYHYKLNDESIKKMNLAYEAAHDALHKGMPFTPTKEQTMYSNMEYFFDTYDEIKEGSELSKYYIPYKKYDGTPEKETKRRDRIRYDEYKEGILCKPCPVCGYKYGTKWIKEDVPQEVIDWLFNLPETKIKPAWV